MLEVKYSCAMCGLHRVVCRVATRKPGQDLGEWMDLLTLAISVDHRKRSPGCRPKTLSEVMIPMTEGDPVGSASS